MSRQWPSVPFTDWKPPMHTLRVPSGLLAPLSALCLVACHQEVDGTYDTTWSGEYLVRLTGIGEAQEQTVTSDGVATFTTASGDIEISLADYCGAEEVICPEEVWPASINITESWKDAGEGANESEHSLTGTDATGAGSELPGVVDHDDSVFGFLLESAATAESTGTTDCAALQASVAAGIFDLPEGEALPAGITNGSVLVAWGGACAGVSTSAAVLSIREDFTAARAGDVP